MAAPRINEPSAKTLSADKSLMYLLHHIFLPPKLAQDDDSNEDTGVFEQDVLCGVSSALASFISLVPDTFIPAVYTCQHMLNHMMLAQPSGTQLLGHSIQSTLSDMPVGDTFALHLRAQNAGILITRSTETFTFETFELLAPNNVVMDCKGSLIRTFPSSASTLPHHIGADKNFVAPFTETILQLDIHTDPETRPQTEKAGAKNTEERDTVNPMLVTDMLASYIRGVGGQDVSVTHIQKRSREQVIYNAGHRVAWHRSASWLFLRVVLRLVLDRADRIDGRKPSMYKTFMAFFMATILEQALKAGLCSDDLFAMSAKISRRVHKLGIQERTPWLDYIIKTIQATNCLLEGRWKQAQNIDATKLHTASLNCPDFVQDAVLDLKQLSLHLKWVTFRPHARLSRSSAGENHQLLRHSPKRLPSYLGSSSAMDLLEFESWVSECLQEWTRCQIAASPSDFASKIDKMKELITCYHGLALELYLKNPEAISVAYLSIMELWVACDKLATHSIPLIADYPPKFPLHMLDKLLLPELSQMQRLEAVELHLQKRTQNAAVPKSSVFENFGGPMSFAVRRFNQMPSFQDKLRQAKVAQAQGRELKLNELADLKSTYNGLMREHNTSSHDQITEVDYYGHERIKCLGHCGKCLLLRRAQNMEIQIWEDLLPARELEAKAVIAELNMDPIIRAWRDVTLELLISIFVETKSGTSSGQVYWLSAFQRLQPFGNIRQHEVGRLQLGSTAKPYAVAHYHSVKVSEAQDHYSVCKPHGCHYSYWDHPYGKPTDGLLGHSVVPSFCSMASLNQSTAIFGRFIRATGHTPNEVIASQHACPQNMSLAEFRAFGHIRAGGRLQWQNILGQLMSPSLSFGSVGTSLLLIQSTCEVGPRRDSDDVLRTTHCLVGDEEVAGKLLEGLWLCIKRAEENWESANAFFIFLVLSTRILSISTLQPIQKQCMEYLKKLRRVSFKWANELLDKVDQSDSTKERKELGEIALFFALICHGTFDVGPLYLPGLLQSAEEASFLLIASVLCQEHLNLEIDSRNPLIKLLLHRRRRLCHYGEGELAIQIVGQKSECLDLAIKAFWPAYVPGEPWNTVETDSRRHILQTHSAAAQNRKSLPVSFNLLSGNLLVDGVPISTLPQEYLCHASFRVLFGSFTPKVAISNRSGMDFSGSRKHHGWDIHFSLQERGLVVQTIRGNAMYEFIPSAELGSDFPSTFCENFFHWLNLTTGTIEFRPLDSCWRVSSASWILQPKERTLIQGYRTLLSLRSKTAVAISRALEPLEDPRYINCILRDRVVEVDLPRLQLTFLLRPDSSTIWSKNYAGMCVAEDQSFGTLIGLKNRLVLKTKGPVSQLDRSIVLIPRGSLSTRVADHRVTVSVSRPGGAAKTTPGRAVTGSAMTHCVFQVDEKLRRLDDSGSLHDKLYLARLHALTAFCLPDPLTCRTGTEESLRILNSASVKSFQRLDSDSLASLKALQKLSPQRHYYPRHLKVMEMVEWSDLPVFSQDDAFTSSVDEILAHDRECQVFHPGAGRGQKVSEESSAFLIERAAARNSVFKVSGFGAEKGTTNYDMKYGGRASQDASRNRGQQVAAIVRLLIQREPKLVKAVAADLSSLNLGEAGAGVAGPTSATKSPPLRSLSIDVQASFNEFIDGQWCRLYDHLSHAISFDYDKYRLGMIFAMFGFSDEGMSAWQTLQTLLTFITVPQIRTIKPPDFEFFYLSVGVHNIDGKIRDLSEKYLRPLRECPENRIVKKQRESDYAHHNRKKTAYDEKVASLVTFFVNNLERQWPCQTPSVPSSTDLKTYMVMEDLKTKVFDLFEKHWRNLKFHAYMDRISTVMKTLPLAQPIARGATAPTAVLHTSHSVVHRGFAVLKDLMVTAPPTMEPGVGRSLVSLLESQNNQADRCHQPDEEHQDNIVHLLESLRSHAADQHERQYITELELSADAVSLAKMGSNTRGDLSSVKPLLLKHFEESRKAYLEAETTIEEQLMKATPHMIPAKIGSHWPRISALLLLEQLSRDQWPQLQMEWKRCLVEFALTLTTTQQAERLLAAKSWEELLKEAKNVGHENWDPMDHPESLLLEVESGLLIRTVQHDIASEMRDPAGNQSSVMQLNMGEGKSSVIVPIVASALADGSNLAVVIVAKPQSKQMCHMMTTKLGGLLNRRIFFLPFSRSLQLSLDGAECIRKMLARCAKGGGILLVQPEELLSFKLMGLESVYAGKKVLGETLVSMQNWLDEVSRHIVDESDENFNVRFELVYTMGAQQPVDLSQQRWGLIQRLLGIVFELCEKMHSSDPTGIQYDRNQQGAMPVIRILEYSAGELLLKQLVDHVCTFGIEGFPIHRQPRAFRDKVFVYITQPNISKELIQTVEDETNGFFCDTTRGPLFLLRGIAAGGVLAFALGQKRWRVNFGRTSTRNPPTLLAVPFRAKDSPAPRSEFSHPDVVILLTCLTYYYEGLTNEELDISFQRLDRADQSEFDLWIRDATNVEPAFRQLSGINLKDRRQCVERIYPSIRNSKAAIDFHLSNVVFAKHMREFPKKLSASGWDIARDTNHPVTGFSGTCDSKYVLPLTIRHLDLPEQQHTNASVIRCLLRPENNVRELQLHSDTTSTKESLSDLLLRSAIESDVPIQVILDVGAQILELDNVEAARQWLRMTPDRGFEATIFFDDDDELSVLNRNDVIERLLTSPYLKQPEKCLVFLDEAHTRGTDLKLPEHYRAAVTLGPKLTKDRLVQACMRMRKLGVGQSVTFFILPEIQKCIRQLRKISSTTALTVTDVLIWSISETWADSRKSIPLWATQGIRHQRQEVIWQRSFAAKRFRITSATNLDGYLEDEAQTLVQRYAPRKGPSGEGVINELHDVNLVFRGKELALIRSKCQEHNILSFESAELQGEQERELSPEIEQERQVQKPAPQKPALHVLAPAVKTFVSNGTMSRSLAGSEFFPAFTTFRDSTASSFFSPGEFPCDIYVTKDFMRTVIPGRSYTSDLYQRSAQWVVTSNKTDGKKGHHRSLVIMSPWEVNELYDELKKSRSVHLHMFLPRTNLAYPSLDHLTLFTMPRLPAGWMAPMHLVIQLNLFAGQLWFDSYDQYTELCRFLGLSNGVDEGEEHAVAADGFEGKTQRNTKCEFNKSPVAFLRVVISGIRADCQDVGRTDLGRILGGEILRPEDFEGRSGIISSES